MKVAYPSKRNDDMMPKPTTAELIERIERWNGLIRLQPTVENPLNWKPFRDEMTALLDDLFSHLSNPWISVEERLPTKQECEPNAWQIPVAIYNESLNYCALEMASFICGRFRQKAIAKSGFIGWEDVNNNHRRITHWYALPPLPNKEGE